MKRGPLIYRVGCVLFGFFSRMGSRESLIIILIAPAAVITLELPFLTELHCEGF